MAVNCYQKLLDVDNTPFVYLVPNQTYSGTVLNSNDADYYRYEMFENETMTFEIRVFPRTLQPINMQLKLYKVVGATLIELGTSFINQFYNQFDYDGNPGEYRFCLLTDFPVDYDMQVQFTDYPFTLFPQLEMYHGAYMPPFEFAKKASTCDSAVFYQLIGGELPPGLYFSSSGYISGIPGELDCVTPPNYEPSFTFFESSPENGDFARISTSYDWEITVRAALVDSPATYADRSFKICIRNNWDYDRDAYMAGLPNFERKKYTEVKVVGGPLNPEQEVDPLSIDNCPCPEPEPLPELTPLEIEELCAVCQINEEFAGLVQINNGSCVVCEEPEPEGPIQLSEIEQPIVCVPCEEPQVVEGLQPISAVPCPCDVETVAIEAEVTRTLYEGTPDFCLDNFISDMFGNKVCDGPITCPVRLPIYPEQPKDVGIQLPNFCEQECDI
jgi:hypothetical protein